ncbi:uncharacterized protein AKAME5_002211800, partial [Lates japonicus]
MASNTPDLPPYVRLVTVYGAVVMRRTVSGLWAGRALRKLDFAKRGLLSCEKEVLEWREVKNTCVVCSKPTILAVLWEEPVTEKPLWFHREKHEYRGIYHKPMK